MLLLLLTSTILAASFITAPGVHAAWAWDLANAWGFVTFSVLLYLFIDSGGRGRRRLHQFISYGGLAALVIHIGWLWLPDPTIWAYLAPSAPGYMWAGIIALLLMLLTLLLALPRWRRDWHPRYKHFKLWHQVLSLMLVVAALWHMLGSGFYLSVAEGVLLAGLSMIIVGAQMFNLGGALPINWTPAGNSETWALAAAFVVPPVAFTLARQLL